MKKEFMKMIFVKKKMIILFVIISITLIFSGCGSENSEKETENKPISESAALEKSDSHDSEAVEEIEKDSSSETDVGNQSDETNEAKNEDASDTSEELLAEADYVSLSESEGFEFETNGDGTCTLKKLGECTDSDIVIPEKSPSGDMVTKIAEYAFCDAGKINSLVIAGKTLQLDNMAFQSCEVNKIVFTGCDLKIGKSTFAYCDDVKEIYFSNSKLEIDEYAFYDCGKKMNVTFKNCIGVLDDKGFQSCGIEELSISNCEIEIGENAFSYCDDLAGVNMVESSLEIGSYAFYDSGDDMAVEFSGCDVELDDKAFQSSGILTLTTQESETKIGENAFSYCDDLTDVVLGENKIEIEQYAFYDCSDLVNVFIAADSKDDDLEIDIDKKAFQSCAVQNVVIGKGNVTIGENAFSYCEDLTNVEFKGSALKVGKYAFYDCPIELAISYNDSVYNKESIEKIK